MIATYLTFVAWLRVYRALLHLLSLPFQGVTDPAKPHLTRQGPQYQIKNP